MIQFNIIILILVCKDKLQHEPFIMVSDKDVCLSMYVRRRSIVGYTSLSHSIPLLGFIPDDDFLHVEESVQSVLVF